MSKNEHCDKNIYIFAYNLIKREKKKCFIGCYICVTKLIIFVTTIIFFLFVMTKKKKKKIDIIKSGVLFRSSKFFLLPRNVLTLKNYIFFFTLICI
jgi:hypothetical protein